MGMTNERIEKLRALCKAATAMPWVAIPSPIQPERYQCVRFGHADELYATSALFPDDAAFIAESRTAVPDLLIEVERLRAENEELRTALYEYELMLQSYEQG